MHNIQIYSPDNYKITKTKKTVWLEAKHSLVSKITVYPKLVRKQQQLINYLLIFRNFGTLTNLDSSLETLFGP
jgi:hypothetical protein